MTTDEIMLLAREYAYRCQAGFNSSWCDVAYKDLQSAIEALQADAARYRWLLKNYATGDGWSEIDTALNDGEADTQLSPAIDAAMGIDKP